MLPRIELKPAYEKVVWLYLYRDFSGSEADLAAERTCLRLGFTSYPQHHLIDPEGLGRLASTGRSIESFLAAVNRVRVATRGGTSDALQRLTMANARAAKLRASGSVAAATKALDDEDVLVRIRAVQILAAKKPAALGERAADLLAIPNDPLRYAVCEALAKTGDARHARALEALVEDPGDSLNPNVLRIRAVQALATCGDAASVSVVGPHAASGVYFNGLTGIAIDALLSIAKRHPDARRAVRDALVEGFPEPAEEPRAKRACEALARRIHGALESVTGRHVAFPTVYDAAARERLKKGW